MCRAAFTGGLSTFVFARADGEPDLIPILALPVSPHPAFSIFRYAGGVPLIREGQVDSLRRAEG